MARLRRAAGMPLPGNHQAVGPPGALLPAVGFLGDLHSDGEALGAVLRRGRALGVLDWVLLGDLEYRPGRPDGQAFLEMLAELAVETGARLRFVRGNHDDAGRLAERAGEADGPVEVAPGLELLPDGCVLELGGLRFLAAGGAPTIPYGRGPEWSPEESMAPEVLERCMAARGVDVVLAHDCPLEVPLPRRHRSWPPGRQHRAAMSALARAVQPRWWLAGHYHFRMSTLLRTGAPHPCRVELLDRNGSGEQQFVLATLEALGAPGDDRRLVPRAGRTATSILLRPDPPQRSPSEPWGPKAAT